MAITMATASARPGTIVGNNMYGSANTNIGGSGLEQLWPKVNPFLPYDKKYAKQELARILLDYGEGVFILHCQSVSSSAGAAVLNGLQSLGLIDVILGYDHVQMTYAMRTKINQRGLDLLKEEI